MQFRDLESKLSLNPGSPPIILVDISMRTEFPRIFQEYQQLSNPPCLVLLHDRKPMEISITGDLLMFTACLDMTGDLSAELKEMMRRIGMRFPFYSVRLRKKLRCVRISDILYLEMDKHSVKLYTPDSTLKAWGTLEQELEKLRPYGFARIHKSYVVNMRHIRQSTSQNIELTGGILLPIGRKYKDVYNEEYTRFIQRNFT